MATTSTCATRVQCTRPYDGGGLIHSIVNFGLVLVLNGAAVLFEANCRLSLI
jgi:hypothetical protein